MCNDLRTASQKKALPSKWISPDRPAALFRKPKFTTTFEEGWYICLRRCCGAYRCTAVNGASKDMPEKRQPSRPIEAYKAIIDHFVTEASRGIPERLVVEEGIWSRSPNEEAANTFVQSLSIEQRRTLARMLHDERTGAIHDVLAHLTWWITTCSVGLTFRGEPMLVGLSGMGLHGDYVGRLNGWEWPQDRKDSPPMPL